MLPPWYDCSAVWTSLTFLVTFYLIQENYNTKAKKAEKNQCKKPAVPTWHFESLLITDQFAVNVLSLATFILIDKITSAINVLSWSNT